MDEAALQLSPQEELKPPLGVVKATLGLRLERTYWCWCVIWKLTEDTNPLPVDVVEPGIFLVFKAASENNLDK